MKTNFIPSFPISKREQEEKSRRIQTLQVKNTAKERDDREKNEIPERHGQLLKKDSNLSCQVSIDGSDDCEKYDPTCSCTSTEMATKVSKK